MIADLLETQKLNLPGIYVEALKTRLDALIQFLQTCQKTPRWKMRSIVGKRMTWYEEVEEVRR